MKDSYNLRSVLVAVAVLSVLGTPLTPSFGTSYDLLTLEEMTQHASVIVVGTVISADYRWESQTSWTYLYVTLDALTWITGDNSSKTLTFRRAVDGNTFPSGTPVPAAVQVGKRVLVFLSALPLGYYRLTSDDASVFPVDTNRIVGSTLLTLLLVQTFI